MSPSSWPRDEPLVLDTNTVLSGLIGETTRRLILEVERELYYPKPSFEEIQRNRGVIEERSGLSAMAIDELVDRLFKYITFVPESDIKNAYETAARATSPHPNANPDRTFTDRDENDVTFLAAAIAIDGDIWSDDGVFEHQDLVEWYRTSEVLDRSAVTFD